MLTEKKYLDRTGGALFDTRYQRTAGTGKNAGARVDRRPAEIKGLPERKRQRSGGFSMNYSVFPRGEIPFVTRRNTT